MSTSLKREEKGERMIRPEGLPETRSAIIISSSSDIGGAMTERWLSRGWRVYGTYRRDSKLIRKLQRKGAELVLCDLSEPESIHRSCQILRKICPLWDVLVLCSGTQEPVGPFASTHFCAWERSVQLNFTAQMRVVHQMLPSRKINPTLEPCVLFFAGGGTNSAPVNYSAYIVSKIALIKMCELLDAEIGDTRFVILGPGWVKTKIHAATLEAKERAGDNYQKTLAKLDSQECTSMETVLDCCDWVVGTPRSITSGRNFSVVFDPWPSRELEIRLARDPQMYKLRRHGNERDTDER